MGFSTLKRDRVPDRPADLMSQADRRRQATNRKEPVDIPNRIDRQAGSSLLREQGLNWWVLDESRPNNDHHDETKSEVLSDQGTGPRRRFGSARLK